MRENPIARLRDDRGQLIDEERKPELFRGSHSILVPMDVQIEQRQPLWSPIPWVSTVPCIVYRVPESWLDGAMTVDLLGLLATGEWGWERGEKISADTWLARGRRGLHGSRGSANPSGLLNDFLKLAHDDLSEHELPASVIEQIAAFVMKWGPLWLCRTPEHHGHGRICFWEPRQPVYWSGTTSLCSWHPVEEVSAFVREARTAKEAVNAIGELRKINLRVGTGDTRLIRQIDQLRAAIWDRLALHGHLELRVNWISHLPQLKLLLLSKIGFIHAVWIEIFQLLCQAKGPFQCDSCSEWFFREGRGSRKPKAGQHHFCPSCSENGRGSKKLNARRRRGSHNMRNPSK